MKYLARCLKPPATSEHTSRLTLLLRWIFHWLAREQHTTWYLRAEHTPKKGCGHWGGRGKMWHHKGPMWFVGWHLWKVEANERHFSVGRRWCPLLWWIVCASLLTFSDLYWYNYGKDGVFRKHTTLWFQVSSNRRSFLFRMLYFFKVMVLHGSTRTTCLTQWNLWCHHRNVSMTGGREGLPNGLIRPGCCCCRPQSTN